MLDVRILFPWTWWVSCDTICNWIPCFNEKYTVFSIYRMWLFPKCWCWITKAYESFIFPCIEVLSQTGLKGNMSCCFYSSGKYISHTLWNMTIILFSSTLFYAFQIIVVKKKPKQMMFRRYWEICFHVGLILDGIFRETVLSENKF